MTNPTQSPEPTQEQHLIFNLFSKFLMDAAQMIANNPTIDAQQCRLRLKEAQDWARSGIYGFVPPTPSPAPDAPAPDSSAPAQEEVKQESQAA